MAFTPAKSLFSAFFAASVASILVSAFQFEVGDEMHWAKPTGKERETYNEWAAQNRFHIGDSLHFKYAKDSVLVVSSDDYENCSTANPIAKFEGGSTVYELDGPGLFFFISGQPGHCKSGQRLIVRVMHPLQANAPEIPPAQAPETEGESGGDSDLPGFSSAAEKCAVSYLIAGFVGMFYLFV